MIQLNDTRYPGRNVINLLLAVYTRQVPTFINTNLVLEEVATWHANVRILMDRKQDKLCTKTSQYIEQTFSKSFASHFRFRQLASARTTRFRSLVRFCCRKHKKSTTYASRSRKNLSSTCRQVYIQNCRVGGKQKGDWYFVSFVLALLWVQFVAASVKVRFRYGFALLKT